jgi:hypothetical protein
MTKKLVTVEEIQKLLPSRKNSVTDETIEIINASMNEPEFQGESLLSTMITYESVMTKNKASISEYINAIRFCAYLIAQEDNYTEAYKRTFINRDFIKERLNVPTDSSEYKQLTSAASRYRSSRLVVDILTLSQVPLDLIFAGARVKALGVLADLMVTAKFDRDKVAAAKELLAATKREGIAKIELDIGIKEDFSVTNLMDQLAMMATRQKTLIESGAYTTSDFGALKVISGEFNIENGN